MRLAFIAIALLALATAGAAQETGGAGGDPRTAQQRFHGWDGPKPDVACTCRHREGRAELGQTICILQGSKRVTARCEMALNNPFWRVLDEGCQEPSS